MTFPFPSSGERPPRQPPSVPPTPSRARRVLIPTVLVLVAIAVLFGMFADFFTELLWFRSIGAQSVFTTRLTTQVLLFVVVGAFVAAVVVGNILLAYRMRPAYRISSVEQQSLDRYRELIEPRVRLVVIVIGLVIAAFVGSTAAGSWQTYLAWRNGTSFGVDDPQFGLDVSFYVFDYPWWRFLLGIGFSAVLLGLMAAAVTHYLFGGLRLQQPRGQRSTPSAALHLAILLGLFVLLKAVAYWLDRYGLVLSQHELFTGASYTDINAVLPGKTIMVFIALICSVLIFTSAVRRTWLLPGVGLGLLVLSTLVIGGVYPLIVQSVKVKPNEGELESPYIQRNIDATRTAYGFEDLEPASYDAVTTAAAGQLQDDAATLPGIRLLDPNLVSPTFEQLQQVRGFYSFPDALDVDRYEIDGQDRDTVIAVREINIDGIPSSQQNWLNETTVYTHGFGVVAAYGNQRAADGSPAFFIDDIPPQGEITEFEPRVYFGENSPPYSIVGAPDGSAPVEFDIPEGEAGTAEPNSYEGEGGVSIGGFLPKLLYAAKYQEPSILLSERVNSESKILYDRAPRLRVEKAAPWLKVDGDPYPAVVDGRILWIMDGYTTVDGFPYAQRTDLDNATSDSTVVSSTAVAAQRREQVNYIRNSVKATVDAYDGTVTLYEWDESDPVLKTWESAFPGLVSPRSDISEELLQHLRYPEDFFKVQREIIAKYHVTDPAVLYSGEELWQIPNDPTATGSFQQPPYYLSLQLPDQDAPAFSLTTTFVPNLKQNLAAFLAVDADATSADYGTFRVLELPSNTQIAGPEQIANTFEADPAVAQQLSLLRAGNSQVKLGNLLTLPVGGGLLYVQPVYVERQSGDATYPLLQRVLAAFGGSDVVGFEPTLQQALDKVFQGQAGVDTGEEPSTVPTPSPTGTPTPGGPTAAPTTPSTDVNALIAEADDAFSDAQDAYAAGDYEAYGAALDRLSAALDQLSDLTGVTAPPSGVEFTSPSPTSSP